MARVLLLVSLYFLALPASAQTPTLDVELLRPINRHETTFKNKYLELCASSVNTLNIAVPVGIAVTGFITRNNQLKRDALYMAGGIVVSSLLTTAIKKAVDRKRPFETYDYIVKRDDESGGLSFPSGHTSAAFCLATEISLRYRKWYFVVPACIYAGSVGWARMYQGVHYPSDVLAGAVVGAGSAWLSWKLQQWMQGRKEKKRTIQLP